MENKATISFELNQPSIHLLPHKQFIQNYSPKVFVQENKGVVFASLKSRNAHQFRIVKKGRSRFGIFWNLKKSKHIGSINEKSTKYWMLHWKCISRLVFLIYTWIFANERDWGKIDYLFFKLSHKSHQQQSLIQGCESNRSDLVIAIDKPFDRICSRMFRYS